jgi:hypothetical protein
MPDAAAASAALEEAYPLEQPAKLEAAVWGCIGRMAPESQPGPSGLRPEHVRLAAQLVPAFGAAFSALVRRVMLGEVGGALVSQSTLSLIPKAKGGSRPVGVGEILRRVAGRIVVALATPAVRAQLEAVDQLALSRFGTTVAYRRVVAAAAAKRWVLQLDVRNAYNEVSRRAILDAAPRTPILGPLIDTLYGGTSTMFIPRLNRCREVSRGVVQGCPLSSLLFACAMARVAADAAAGCNVVQVWYADDGHIHAESAADLGTYFTAFTSAAARSGLTLSVGSDKTQLLAPVADAAEAVAAAGLPGSLPVRDEIKALGGPVLSAAVPLRAERMHSAWAALAVKVETTLTPLRDMQDPQHVMQLLAAAGAWTRVRHHAMWCMRSARSVTGWATCAGQCGCA